MGLIQLVVILLVVGVILYMVESAPFVSATMKPIIRWVIIAFVLIWLITLFVGDVPILPMRR